MIRYHDPEPWLQLSLRVIIIFINHLLGILNRKCLHINWIALSVLFLLSLDILRIYCKQFLEVLRFTYEFLTG